MFNNVALDVVIGLVFIYLLYSLLATILQEIIATNVGLRGWILEKSIRRMLDDSNDTTANKLSGAFYSHPLIKYLADGSWPLKKKPAYIDQETFSKVVIDLLRGQDAIPGSSDRTDIQKSLTDKKILWDQDVAIEKETLLYLKSIWADSQGDVAKFKANLEQWFNEMMQRTTGWYKKYTQIILMGVGLIVAVAFNVDTIKIITKLQNSPKLREQIIAQANDFTKAHPNLDKELAKRDSQIASLTHTTTVKMDSLNKLITAQNAQLAAPKGSSNATTKSDSNKKTLVIQNAQANLASINSKSDSVKNVLKVQNAKAKDLRDSLYNQATSLVGNDINKVNNILSIGWDGGFRKNIDYTSILGWLLTALAISLGAPFWFDLLNKLMQLRGSVSNKDDAKPSTDNITQKTGRVG